MLDTVRNVDCEYRFYYFSLKLIVNMRVHYFFNHEPINGFYKLEIIAFLEEVETSRSGVKRLSFTYLEQLRIFISKDDKYHNNSKHKREMPYMFKIE